MARKGENIHKRKDGRWEARILIFDAVTGGKKYKSLYAKTYSGVKDKLKDCIAEQKSGTVLGFKRNKTATKTFSDVTEEWFETNRMKQKASTQLKYHNLFNDHILPAFGKKRISEINEVQINSFLADKLKNGSLAKNNTQGPGLSNAYVRTMSILLNSVLSYAAIKGYRHPLNTTIYKPADERKCVAVLSDSDLSALNSLLETDTSCVAVGIAIALNTGLRIGEVCALSWDDTDLDNRVIHVNHTVVRIKNDDSDYTINGKVPKTRLILDTPKTKTSKREIPINSRLYKILVKAKKDAVSDYVVSNKFSFLSPRTFEYHFHKFLKDNGITDTHFHVLRHSFSTKCVEKNMDTKTLSEVLGHSNVSTTLNIYVHSSMALKRSQLEKLAC